MLFSRQLSTLINAGLPLVQSLRNVNDQTTSKPLKVIISEIITDVEAGNTLSAAMAKHPQVFNQVYISLIAAGEASGTLDKALERLAIQQEKDADIVSKVRGAMIYPVIVLVVMIAVVGFMVVKVLPQVKTYLRRIAWRPAAADYQGAAGDFGLCHPFLVGCHHHAGLAGVLYDPLGPNGRRQASNRQGQDEGLARRSDYL